MNLRRSIPFLCAFAMISTGSGFAQFGYVTQAPAAAAGLGQAAMSADPYMAAGGMMYGNQGAAPMMGMAPVQAGGLLTYGQLEAGYVYNTFKDKSVDPSSGISLGLMTQLFNPFFLHGRFNWSSGNGKSLSTEGYNFSTVSVGAGAYFQITPQIHVVGEVGGLYSSLSANKSSVSFSDGAIYVNPYLRIAASEQLELNIGVLMTSADKYNSRVLELGGYYRLFTSMDLGLGADLGNEQNAYHLGVRFRW